MTASDMFVLQTENVIGCNYRTLARAVQERSCAGSGNIDPMRLQGKIAVIVGAGQTPGEGMGNGRATTLRFARSGAKVLAVDRDLASAQQTAAMVQGENGVCEAFEADVTDEQTLAEAMQCAVERWGRVDILHNNVGVSIAGGDASALEITEEAFDRMC